MYYWKIRTLANVALLSLVLVGCSKTADRAIEDVLNRCARITKHVNSSKMSAAEAATYIANEDQKIDLRDCPPEFRVAFQQHINAWRQAAPYFAQDTGLAAFLEGFAAGMSGNDSMVGLTHENASIASQNINSTYYQLVNLAAAYGARVPNSVVSK
jgi:hypothetical protein